MRILAVAPGPGFSVADVYAGWVEAFRELGQNVLEFPLGDLLCFYDAAHIDAGDGFKKALSAEQVVALTTDRLAAALFKIRPHMLFVVSAFFSDAAVLDQARRNGTRVVLLNTESPYEEGRQLLLAPHADLVLLNDPTNLAEYETLTPTVYAPHAYRERVHCPGPSEAAPSDLAFVGTGYPSRVDFFDRMGLDGLRVALAGNWMGLDEDSPLRRHVIHDIDGCFDNADAVDLYRAASASVNIYRREAETEDLAVGWACGPREIELAATGCFYLRDPRPEGDELFPMLPTFAGPEDAGEQLRWWLDHPADRVEAARQARAAVSERTFANHAARLLRMFDQQPVTA
jgi:hypothetical protein